MSNGQSNVLAANELRTVRELLWDVVKASLKPSEVDEVSSLARMALTNLTPTHNR